MSLSDYDKIVLTIEKNLTQPWDTVAELLEKELLGDLRNIQDFRRRISGDELTLRQYYLKRKVIRALCAHKETGQSIISIAEALGFSDHVSFYRAAQAYLNKGPKELLEKGEIEKLKKPPLLEDIINEMRTFNTVEDDVILEELEREKASDSNFKADMVDFINRLNRVDDLEACFDSLFSEENAVDMEDAFDLVGTWDRMCAIYADENEEGKKFLLDEATAFFNLFKKIETRCQIYDITLGEVMEVDGRIGWRELPDNIDEDYFDKAAEEMADIDELWGPFMKYLNESEEDQDTIKTWDSYFMSLEEGKDCN